MKKFILGLGIVLPASTLGLIGVDSANAALIGAGEQFNVNYTVQVNNACFLGAGNADCVDNAGTLELSTGEFAGGANQLPDILFAPTADGDQTVDVGNRVLDQGDAASAGGIDAAPGELGIVQTGGGNTGVFSNFGAFVAGEIRNFEFNPLTGDSFFVDQTTDGSEFMEFVDPVTGNIFRFGLKKVTNFAINTEGAGTVPLGDYEFDAIGNLSIYDPTDTTVLDSSAIQFRTTGQFLFDCRNSAPGAPGSVTNNPACGSSDPYAGDLVTNLTSSSASQITVIEDVPEPGNILGLASLLSFGLLFAKKKIS